MLPKTHRLTRAEVEHLVRHGAAYHSTHLTLRALPPQEDSNYHFGFAASRKVSLLAVVRNRLRRQGYFAVESFLRARPLSLNGIFYFKRGSSELSREEVEREVHTLLLRCRIGRI
jgi:ribonuclease P protein component